MSTCRCVIARRRARPSTTPRPKAGSAPRCGISSAACKGCRRRSPRWWRRPSTRIGGSFPDIGRRRPRPGGSTTAPSRSGSSRAARHRSASSSAFPAPMPIPYLAVAATLGARLVGDRERDRPGGRLDRQRLSAAGPRAPAIAPRARRGRGEGFRASPEARAIFGETFIDHFAATRDWEERQFGAPRLRLGAEALFRDHLKRSGRTDIALLCRGRACPGHPDRRGSPLRKPTLGPTIGTRPRSLTYRDGRDKPGHDTETGGRPTMTPGTAMLSGNWNYPTAIRFGAGRVSELPDACRSPRHERGRCSSRIRDCRVDCRWSRTR